MSSLLVGVGNILGKGPCFSVGPEVHYPNLFLALVGDTASGKGQAWSIAHYLLKKAEPDWASQCLCYGLSSGEGLIERIKDEEQEQGEGVILKLPEPKRLLCLETEFAKPITAMRREGNTLSPVLRCAFDGQTLEVSTRKSKLKASNAHVSIIAHITLEEAQKLLQGSVEVANGFANRFLWCLVKRSKLLPDGGNISVLDAFAEPLAKALATAKDFGTCKRSPEAAQLWHDVYPSLSEARPGAFGKATERSRPLVMRLALLYAVLDGSPVIGPEHLQAALALWGYCEISAKIIFGEGESDTLGQMLLQLIRQSPGINRRQLHKALGGHMDAQALANALAKLRDSGSIRLAKQSTGGRPGECYWPLQTPTPLSLKPEPLPSAPANEQSPGPEPEPEPTQGQCPGPAPQQQQEPEPTPLLVCSFARSPEQEPKPEPEHFADALVSSFARSEAPALSLAQLFAGVNAIAGRLERKGEEVIVNTPAGITPSPELLQGLKALQGELLKLMPEPKPLPSPEQEPELDAELAPFKAELNASTQ